MSGMRWSDYILELGSFTDSNSSVDFVADRIILCYSVVCWRTLVIHNFRYGWTEHAKVQRRIRKVLFSLRIWKPRNENKINNHLNRSTDIPGNESQSDPLSCNHNADSSVHVTRPLGDRFISVGCWNAQSIRNKSAIFLDVLQEHKFQVISLCETWHMDHEDIAIKKVTPEGYKCIEAARPRPTMAKKGRTDSHGGVALIYRSNLYARKMSFDFKPTTFEIVAAHVSSVNANAVFIVIYRPGSAAINEVFFTEFNSILEAAAVYNSNIVITGDFNIHVDNPEDKNALKFLQLLESFGFGSVRHWTDTHGGAHTGSSHHEKWSYEATRDSRCSSTIRPLSCALSASGAASTPSIYRHIHSCLEKFRLNKFWKRSPIESAVSS